MKYTYIAKPVDTGKVTNVIKSWTIDDPGLNQFLRSNGIDLQKQVFSLKRLYLTSLYYDPEMLVAYKKWKKAQIVAEQTDYYINPELSIPFEHHSDTSGDISEWTIGAVLGFIYERKGKREVRQAMALVNLLNAKLAMDQLASERYGNIVALYHTYIVTRTKIADTKNEIGIFKELLELLKKKYELGAESQFELNSIKLELQQRLFQLSLQKNILQENKDDLLVMTNLSHSEFESIGIEYISPLALIKELYQKAESEEVNISSLQTTMLDNHYEMAIQLNKYAEAEAELRLEIENQYPDLVLSPGFIFDQSDNIWTLGTSWVLPLFEKSRQNLKIIKALEDRKIKQQEIIVLQKKLLDSLYKKHNSIIRYRDTLKVSDEIIETIEKRANEIKTRIEIGGADRIAMLRNRMEFYKAKLAQTGVYEKAINAMQEFNLLLQNSYSHPDIGDIVTSWIDYIDEKNNDEPVN